MIALSELNAAATEQFTAALDGIFEHSPWIAARAAAQRPFASRLDLLDAMCGVVTTASESEQLALIRAHPELAGRAMIRNELTAASAHEQHGAGLGACTQQEFARLQELNHAYTEQFGFPFIMAVRGHDCPSILRAFAARLHNDAAAERRTALEQIARIAEFRLSAAVSSPLGDEIMAMHDRLARFSDDEQALTCTYLSAAHRATAARIRDLMLAAGLDAEIDAIGNVVGHWRCGVAGAKTLITGSHYDTVINGGKYDGRLGILLPIACVTELRQRPLTLPYDLQIVAFADEEGVRYKSTFLGSSAFAGTFDARLLDAGDEHGISLRTALRDAGFDPDAIAGIARDQQKVAAYVEVHIEQGPVLLEADRAVGVVTAIAGSVRMLVSIAGLAGHAGTVPMALRRDAAAAAAEIVLAVEKCCSGVAGLVGTVGKLDVPGGAINVIPGRCELSIDLRAGDDGVRDAAVREVLAQIESIGTRRNVTIAVRRVLEAAGVPCAPQLQQQFAEAITHVTGFADPLHLPSGAGHDAMKMAALAPVGMLFVRCGNGGISHHPDETLSAADAETAARTFIDFLLRFKNPTT